MSILRSTLVLATLGAALAARANFINFDNLASGTSVGNAYLASDGVSFLNGTVLAFSGVPSAPNALFPDTTTLTVNCPLNVLSSSVGLFYASNSLGSGSTTIVPSLTVYSGLNGTGNLLGTLALPDTGPSFTNYAQVTLPFAGSARSFVLSDVASSHIIYDNLSFTSQPAPEPSSMLAVGVGAIAFLRRRKR